MESLEPEVAPFGIHTTIVDLANIRTQVRSATYAESSLQDYADRTADQLRLWEDQSGRQPGDPAKLVQELVAMAGQESPPPRFIAGADAIALAERKVAPCSRRYAPSETCRHRWTSTRSRPPATGARRSSRRGRTSSMPTALATGGLPGPEPNLGCRRTARRADAPDGSPRSRVPA
jgi:hypothetical protein